MKRIVVALLACVALMAACESKEKETAVQKKKEQRPVLVIGLIPEQNIFKQIDRYEPIGNYISDKTGLKVVLKPLPRYGNIIDNFVSEGMDGAFFGSFTYALAYAKLGLEVIARPERLDGVSTYHGLIFVRTDSGIKTAEDMKGKRFAFVDKATTAGYLLPLAYFKKHGIKNYRTYLKEAYFAGTHEDAIYDVLNKKADIGAAKNTLFERLASSDGSIKDNLTILERSSDVPENGLAVRKDLDSSIKNKIKEVLLDMHNDPAGKKVLEKFGARRFIETTYNDYMPVFEYAKRIGLDLTSYDYIND